MVLMVLGVMLRGSEAVVPWLLMNTIVGVVLLFVTNLVLIPPILINPFTILICAVGGVVGWLFVLILHLLEVAF
ncbi:MAG TPA: pro-sigmaK processing inhibitor BofA family protein, partial [Rubrobacteraceae bacterium]|nr:pro-sigmaK processing inhibitor BofA family protein [Rubrobacteraceae bacterium]